MKKMISLLLALAILLSPVLTVTSSAAKLPDTRMKSYDLTDKAIEVYDLTDKRPTVSVSLNGYLGEMSAEQVGIPSSANPADMPVYILKAGSKVVFTIASSDPNAKYNHCYDPQFYEDEYSFIYDNWGGGVVYTYNNGKISPDFYITPTAVAKGKVALNSGVGFTMDAQKLTNGVYEYISKDGGLATLCFTAKEVGVDDSESCLARYTLGNFLFISDEQYDELEKTGTMSFHKQYSGRYDYQHNYPGLLEAIKGESKPVQPVQPAADAPSAWAAAEVQAAIDAGIVPEMTGAPKYQDTMTREQFAELIVQMVKVAVGNIDTTGTPAFKDTNNQRLLEAAAAGIVTGTSTDPNNPTASPKLVTNREQIASMIYRAILYIEKQTGVTIVNKNTDISTFADNASVSAWAKEGVGVLANNDIMNGSGNSLSPANPCTVEQSILLVYRTFIRSK